MKIIVIRLGATGTVSDFTQLDDWSDKTVVR
jgi:hypothetical protein